MGTYFARPEVDNDLVTSAAWIERENPEAALRFLDAAFKSFDFLSRFPQAGPQAPLKNERLKDVRFWVLPPPFNKWLIFYRIESDTIVMLRVLHATQNWRDEPEEFL